MLNPTPARLSRLLFLVALALLVSGQALATTFDFTGSAGSNALGLDTGSLGHRLTLTEGDLTLRVRAFDDRGDRGQIHRGTNGLGVASNPARGNIATPEAYLALVEQDYSTAKKHLMQADFSDPFYKLSHEVLMASLSWVLSSFLAALILPLACFSKALVSSSALRLLDLGRICR